jgi:transposase
LAVTLASAQDHDVRWAQPTLTMVRVPQRRGRPRTRLPQLTADKGYDSRAVRQWLRQRGTATCIPLRAYAHRRRVGRRPTAARHLARQRWRVERSFAWLQQFRRLAVRWDHSLVAYHGFVTVACIVICLRKFP